MRYSLPTFRNGTAMAMSVVLVMASMPDFAHAAKRLGGGSSIGRQQSNITQRKADPVQRNTNAAPAQQAAPTGAAPGSPATPAAAPGAAAAPAGAGGAGGAATTPAAAAQRPAASPSPAAAPQQPARNRWLGPLAGLAAGIGLAALFSHLGLGDELASFISSFLMIALLAVAGIFLFRLLTGRRRAAAAPAYAGAGTGGPFDNTQASQSARRESFEPAYAGTGATQRQSHAFDTQTPAQAPLGTELNAYGQPIASLGTASGFEPVSAEPPLVDTPEGFDIPGFERSARQVFVRLQAANDAGDINTLREFASDELMQAFKQEIDARGGAVDPTEVIDLQAQLIAYERDFDEHIASVLFRGQIRESKAAPAEHFEEIWNLARPVRQGGGWVLVGIQSV